MGGKGSGVRKNRTVESSTAPERATTIRGGVASPEQERTAGIDQVTGQFKAGAPPPPPMPGPAPESPGDEERKERRRKREAERAAIDQAAVQAEKMASDFALFSEIILEFIGERLPNPKPVSNIEKQMMSNAVAEMVKKYAPQITPYAPEAALVLAVGLFVGNRISLKKKPTPKPAPDTVRVPVPDGGTVEVGTVSAVSPVL